MKEVIKKLNELRELMAKHDEIISCNIVNISTDRRAEILVDTFKDVPKENASYRKFDDNIRKNCWVKTAEKNGVKIESYGSIGEVISEMRSAEND